jgi:hypothetical protein
MAAAVSITGSIDFSPPFSLLDSTTENIFVAVVLLKALLENPISKLRVNDIMTTMIV